MSLLYINWRGGTRFRYLFHPHPPSPFRVNLQDEPIKGEEGNDTTFSAVIVRSVATWQSQLSTWPGCGDCHASLAMTNHYYFSFWRKRWPDIPAAAPSPTAVET